ncbi:MAG: SPW repeat protein [Candidatus Liptonbacteria bacterium]|nr:SPW repeat protein [Candidatus Liptonbacteria bacterium]
MTSRWVELIAGFWIIISPWVLGFSSISLMKWSNVISGVLIVLLSAWAIFEKKVV